MSSGNAAYYNSEKRLNTIYSNNVISPIAGVNPVDGGYVDLPNIRGQLTISITSGDNSYTSSFIVTGGFGQYPNDYTINWNLNLFSAVGCTLSYPSLNIVQINTPVADAGGRTYLMQFFTAFSVGPQIRQTSPNLIGNNILTVKIFKTIISTEGY